MKLKVNSSTIEHLVATGCTDLIVEGIKQLEAENARLNDNIDKLCKHGDLEMARLNSEIERLTLEYRAATNHYNKLHNDLQAEADRLTEIIRREVDGGVDLREEAQRIVEENHSLKAEVEQLKAQIEDQAQRCADYEDLVKHYKQQRDEAYNDLPDWQPIKTAPKDGTWVLLATDTPDAKSGIHELDAWFPDVAMGRYVGGWMRCSEYSVSITPTHWAIMPEPPAAKGVQS